MKKENGMSGAMRPKFNGKGMSWQGDKTSHGGIVMTGFRQSTWNGGIAQARLGDEVFCPICKPHRHTISNASGINVFGVRAALEGDKTTCGAVLLAERASEEQMKAAAAFICALGREQVVKAFMYREVNCARGRGWILYEAGYPFAQESR